jgi:hypothetical protein
MTTKEIAAKILIVIDRHETSYSYKCDEGGFYSKSIDNCFQEVFQEDTFSYYPYNMAIKQSRDYMKFWAKEVLKQD